MDLYQEDPLYLAIMANDEKAYAKLKERKVTISDHIKYTLTHAVGSLAKINEYSYTWWAHIAAVEKMDKNRFVAVMTNLHKEIGEPMYFSDSIYWPIRLVICEHAVFECMLDCFDNKKINKKRMMQEIIKRDDVELLSMAAGHGWLKMPRKRDEMIAFASDNDKTECLAWLLDFKNRTADLPAEQERAEKKLLRELNASPDSASELKKLWSWKKQENETLIITSCKRAVAEQKEITVPNNIGKYSVAAIGPQAFSPYASRISNEIQKFRSQITKITLPDSIKKIEGAAFSHCASLEEMEIPDSVEEIDTKLLFYYCSKLKTALLPKAVHKIDSYAFYSCSALERVNIPEGTELICSYAFANCISLKEINIPFGCRIESDAFSGCVSLEKINFCGGVKKIGTRALYGCRMLKTIVIPEGMEEIGGRAFANCSSLETIFLPRSLKKINNHSVKGESPRNAFYDCTNVKAVVYKDSYSEKYCRRNNVPYEIREEE